MIKEKDILDGDERNKDLETRSILSSLDIQKSYLIFDQNKEEGIKDTFEKLSLKTKKVVGAAYALSAIIDKEEPIRKEIRKTSLSILSFTATNHKNVSYQTIDSIASDIKLLKDHILLAKFSEIISPMNASLMIGEIDAISELVSLFQSSEKISFIKDKFIDKKNIQEKKEFLKSTELPRLVNSYKKVIQNKKKNKDSRREEILSFIPKGIEISIKDISSKVKNCSEKTIQRELNNLVSEKLIIRIGEKRWSKYRRP